MKKKILILGTVLGLVSVLVFAMPLAYPLLAQVLKPFRVIVGSQ